MDSINCSIVIGIGTGAFAWQRSFETLHRVAASRYRMIIIRAAGRGVTPDWAL